jgi:DNA-binding transcriptional ArsR family regulator
VTDPAHDKRWQLYRLLSEPLRLRLLALAAAEELNVGELADLLGESQPNVSRHAAPMRRAGLLVGRRDGTRLFLRLAESPLDDPVVIDAVETGRQLCGEDGSLHRITEVVRARDAHTREFFSRKGEENPPEALAVELPAYLHALATVLNSRDVAVDAGTGNGVLLDLLAPLFVRVIGIDRSEAQLARASARVGARSYQNVELVRDEIDGELAAATVGEGADVVVSARMLHHAPLPRAAVAALARLARPGGSVVIVDYLKHDDESLSRQQADVWMGFAAEELLSFASSAGLVDYHTFGIPARYVGGGLDAHLGWQALVGQRAHLTQSGSRGMSAMER